MKRYKSIMLIDDDDIMNYLHVIHLQDASLADEIIIEESSVKALDKLLNGEVKPEVIFLDINMPKMNGWEFLEQYSKKFKPEDIQIVIVSASIRPQDREKAVDHPYVIDFVEKPMDDAIIEDLRKFIL